MTNQDKDSIEDSIEKSDNRMMWIATAVIVLILVGGMGANMLFHHDTINNPVDTDRKSTRLNSSHIQKSRMPSSA